MPILLGLLLCLKTASAAAETPVTLQNKVLALSISPETGHCIIRDRQASINWGGTPEDSPFGTVTVRSEGKSRAFALARCEVERTQEGRGIQATFRPLPEDPSATVIVTLTLASDPRLLRVRYQTSPNLQIESISPLAHVLTASDSQNGYVVVPAREGLLIPANSGISFQHRFDTSAYEGCHMQMLGLVEGGAAALVTWDDPYVAADITSVVEAQAQPKTQQVNASLNLTQSARTFEIRILGPASYVDIAKTYRRIARQKGLLVTWDKKLKGDPKRAKLFGAANIKLWSALDRRMNEESTREESVKVNWTFEEAAQVADHFKRDLGLDRVLFTIGGWIHRGYDNQHPDILPAAPECGGDAELAECARHVMDLGYLFCLHDNYQDMYRDSPSWNERFLMKTRDGKPARGGHWAGGMAFLTCSQMALELAERPQNLAAVKKITQASAYFIDTTYASGLQECFDPQHPLTRSDDLKWKQQLSDYARGIFGVFGSECGREWAIPHSDFFEGLTGVSGRPYHDAHLPESLGATVIPLFELVYHDCIAMYGKYGYDPEQSAKYVLEHILFARPLNYHSIPAHLYWKRTPVEEPRRPESELALFTHAEKGWAEGMNTLDRFIKNTYEVLSPLNELTARLPMLDHKFLTADRQVQYAVFGQGSEQVQVTVNLGKSDYVHQSTGGESIKLPQFGFLVESSNFVAVHALNWNGHVYASAPFFTLRSLDGKPLSRSHKVRIFHAFGDERIQLRGALFSVPREETIDPKARH